METEEVSAVRGGDARERGWTRLLKGAGNVTMELTRSLVQLGIEEQILQTTADSLLTLVGGL